MENGEDWKISFNLRDESKSYLNLTGYSIDAKMSKSYTSSIKYSLNPQITDVSTGLIELSMPNSGGQLITKTQDLKPGRYVYTVFITSPASITDKVLEGIITVNPSVL